MEIFPGVGIPIWGIVKIFLIIGMLVYLVFAAVLVKQVNLMTDTLDVGFVRPVRFIATAHLVFAVLVFILTVFII